MCILLDAGVWNGPLCSSASAWVPPPPPSSQLVASGAYQQWAPRPTVPPAAPASTSQWPTYNNYGDNAAGAAP